MQGSKLQRSEQKLIKLMLKNYKVNESKFLARTKKEKKEKDEKRPK